MPTTLDELIERLEGIRRDIAAVTVAGDRAGEAEVRFAHNPAWPMQHEIDGRDLAWRINSFGEVAVYLPDGGQAPGAYLPDEIAKSFGWS